MLTWNVDKRDIDIDERTRAQAASEGEQIPMTSFSDQNAIRIQNARTVLKNMYPDGKEYIDSLILEVQVNTYGEKKVIYIGPKGGNNGNLFRQDGEVNSKLNKELLGVKEKNFNEVRDSLLKDLKSVYEYKEERERIEKELEDNIAYAELETTSPEASSLAFEKNEKLEKELEKLEDNLLEAKSRLGLKINLREKILAIFKKYGLSIATVVLTTSALVTSIISIINQNSVSKNIKKFANGVGKQLKNLGKKLGEILPGLIAPIVSFLFKTTGEAISFIGKNLWLIIVATVLYLFGGERIRRR